MYNPEQNYRIKSSDDKLPNFITAVLNEEFRQCKAGDKLNLWTAENFEWIMGYFAGGSSALLSIPKNKNKEIAELCKFNKNVALIVRQAESECLGFEIVVEPVIPSIPQSIGVPYDYVFNFNNNKSGKPINKVVLEGVVRDELAFCKVGTKIRLWTDANLEFIFGYRSSTVGGQGKTLIFEKTKNRSLTAHLSKGNRVVMLITAMSNSPSLCEITLEISILTIKQ
jgi:hypothetical protein